MLGASKAFDRLVHPILCLELLGKGIPAENVIILRQLLSSSSGIVDYDGVRSDTFDLRAGVRQDSLLGGLL